MKPIFLKFCGINSYAKEFCIDFESLAKDGIFGIFGATGSGKSTILDAITLALYGKVPRHNKTTHSSFVNSDSSTASVEFIFEATMTGGEKSRFEIHRVYKKNNKGGVNVSKCLFRLVDGDILADRKEGEVNTAIIAAVGLSYEDFTRSVFLPQNKFNEFMFLDSKDRSKMLERLFDLEKFGEGLKSRINAFESRAKTAVENCELNISFYGEISAEMLSEKQNLLDDVSKEIARLAKERELFFGERERYMALEAAYVQYLAARREQEYHTSSGDEIKDKIAALDAAKAASALQSPIDGLKSLTQQHRQAQESLGATQQLAKAAGAQAKEYEAQWNAARKTVETDLPMLLRREQELNVHLERFVEIESMERELKELRDKWKIEEGSLKAKKKKEGDVSANIADIKGKLDGIARHKSSIAIDPEMLKALIDAAATEKELHGKNLEIGRLEAQLAKHNKAIVDFSELFAKNQDSLAGQLAQNLEGGLPCPVCGSLHHPNPANHTPGFAGHANDDIKEKLSRAKAMHESIAENLAKLARDKAALADSLERYQKSLLLDNFDMALQEAFEKNARRATLDEQEAALRTEAEAITEMQKSLMLEISGLVSMQEATLAAGTEKAAAIEVKRAALGGLGDIAATQAALADIESQKSALVVAERELEDLKNKYQAEYLEAEKSLASLTERVQNLSAMGEAQQAAIDRELVACGFDSMEAAESAILPQAQMAALETEIKGYEQKKSELTSLLSNLSKTLENIDNLEEIPEAARTAQERFALADTSLMEKREASAVLSQEIAKTTIDLEAMTELLSQKKGLEARHAALREIADLFRGNAFIKFLAARHLQYITNEATSRLGRMTGGRYAIEYDEDTNFIIRDDFNGGARRPPASLSGGETFMASLCLALALSAKIQMKSRANLSFFFLD